MRLQYQKGFTLVELLITVTIIAILGAVAVPSYVSYTERSALRSTQSDIAALSLSIENEYQLQLAYPTLNLTTNDAVLAEFEGWRPSSDDFKYTITSSATAYTVTAEATQGGLKDCKLTLNSSGVRELLACTKHVSDKEWL